MIEKNVEFYNLADDLKAVLVGYLSPLDLKFSLKGQSISLEDTFLDIGTLSLFIYDKQPYINSYLEKVRQNTELDFFSELVFTPAAYSFMQLRVEFNHNLTSLDNLIYRQFIFDLAEQILSDKTLQFIDETVVLDEKFDAFQVFLLNIMQQQMLKRTAQ